MESETRKEAKGLIDKVNSGKLVLKFKDFVPHVTKEEIEQLRKCYDGSPKVITPVCDKGTGTNA